MNLDTLLGLMDTPELAEATVLALNRTAQAESEPPREAAATPLTVDEVVRVVEFAWQEEMSSAIASGEVRNGEQLAQAIAEAVVREFGGAP